ncbi:MAG: hypothetical protein MUF52_16380 [Syntrophobacteraceae bacterium]|jgi:hypothetical protein|nr:hypothetical protein [Syntrophobacteraceae bacterium]
MELAFHLRDWGEQDDGERGLLSHIAPSTMDIDGCLPAPVRQRLARGWAGLDRIYVGDEFCFHRLPTVGEISSVCRWAGRYGLPLTLLTPVMSDAEIQRGLRLVELMLLECSDLEVVVNDWGVLQAFRGSFPLLGLCAGRVFNKAYKDPRPGGSGNGVASDPAMSEVTSYSTFRQPGFRSLLDRFGVTRLERDLLPHETTLEDGPPGFASSIYFPWGYVTTGRICWSASFRGAASARFAPPAACARPCGDFSLSLNHESFGLEIVQNGNTVYYRYSDAMLRGMMEAAGRGSLRLVCQAPRF